MKTDLIVLALIKRNVGSGYDILNKIKKITVKNANIPFGTIYYMLRNFLAKGWIKKTGSIRNFKYPEKHLFKITPEEERYLKNGTKKYLKKNKIFFDTDEMLMLSDGFDDEIINDSTPMFFVKT